MKTQLLVTLVLLILIPLAGNAQLELYPNPVIGNEFTISSKERIERIEIYNVLGERVVTEKFSGTRRIINISNLKAGVYIVNVFDVNSKSYLKKILIE